MAHQTAAMGRGGGDAATLGGRLPDPSEPPARDNAFTAYAAPLGRAPWPSLDAAVASAADYPADRKLCVLLATGAMSPPHRGHVDMLVCAKRALETQGFAVLHGWMSPAHDLYVGPKAHDQRTFFANAAHRVAMADLATQHLPWCSVGTWEARDERRSSYSRASRTLQETIHSMDGAGRAKDIHVFGVCGGDHAEFQRDFDGKNLQGLVVVPRDGDMVFKDKPSRLVYGVHEPNATAVRAAMSSTAVRAAFAAGRLDRAEGMLGRGVTEYCCEHSLYGAPAMEEGGGGGGGGGEEGKGGQAGTVLHEHETQRVAQTLHGAAASPLLSPVPRSGAERTDEEGAGAAAVPPPGAPSKQLTLAGMASALDLEKQVEPKRLSMPRHNHPTKTAAQLIVHTHKEPAKAVIDAQPRSSTSLSQIEDKENGCGVRTIVRVDDPIAFVEGGDDVRRQILERDAPEMLQYVGDGGRVGLSNVSRM
jgi:nicotinic acid mononucleotide adenylyltransferase